MHAPTYPHPPPAATPLPSPHRPPGSRWGVGAQSVLEQMLLDRLMQPEAVGQQRRAVVLQRKS